MMMIEMKLIKKQLFIFKDLISVQHSQKMSKWWTNGGLKSNKKSAINR